MKKNEKVSKSDGSGRKKILDRIELFFSIRRKATDKTSSRDPFDQILTGWGRRRRGKV